jgi:glycosyltransferase involved in cell wall biosynthesis
MKIVSLRANPSIYFHNGLNASLSAAEKRLEELTFNSAPINIGRELARRQGEASFTEWRLWGFPSRVYELNGIPVRMFSTSDGHTDLRELQRHIRAVGEPDVLWAEGIHFPEVLRRVFELCPKSLKINYPKYSEPWLIQGLEYYDGCLVDEHWQVEEMAWRHPGVRCLVWNKLVDYEHHFFPMPVPKRYDICYVARLHARKYHNLLFDALAKIPDRRLSVVLVGEENDFKKHLQPMADQAGTDVTFSGHVPRKQVNELINASRIGVLCDKYDAAPRAMLEYMAADVPVLATSEMRAGIRYIGERAGLACPPERFHEGIIQMLEWENHFAPREHLIEHFSRHKVVDRFQQIVADLQATKLTVPS